MCIIEKISTFEFQPEVYVYPTPRAYAPLHNFTPAFVEYGDEINVYIHIPFCRQICSYCGYLKIAGASEALIDRYVDALVKEILRYGDILSSKKIVTLNIGGGTPSLLKETQLAKIFLALLSVNPEMRQTAQKEISLEATPESIELEKFSAFREIGINRVSIGVQTLNSGEIACAKRKNTSDITEQAIEKLRKSGISQVVADLMIGIEGQSVESFTESATSLIQLRPDVVELYALGLQPQTALAKSSHGNLLQEKDLYRCYEIGMELFLNAGYEQDCHNRYALPDRGGYLQEDNVFGSMSIIGFGAGARTYAQNVHYRNSYCQNNFRKSVLEYIEKVEAGKSVITDGVMLSSEEKMRQFLIYNIEDLDCSIFQEMFGKSPEDVFPEIFSKLLQGKILFSEGNSLKMTKKGLLFRDLVAKEFFSDYMRSLEINYRPRISDTVLL
jgi:oxygen-independent coproporphyrinogen-3 oxidase